MYTFLCISLRILYVTVQWLDFYIIVNYYVIARRFQFCYSTDDIYVAFLILISMYISCYRKFVSINKQLRQQVKPDSPAAFTRLV